MDPKHPTLNGDLPFGVEARDPASFTLAMLALLLAGATACLAPAVRAATVHPTESL